MATSSLRVRSALTLESGSRPLGNQRWLSLLSHLQSSASITAAAKAAGLSYKAAWDAIETMNNLSPEPLVARVTGGKGGGGTRLTARGQQLVSTYAAVVAENQRFMTLLNSRINHLDQDLRVIGRLTMLTSARNHFAGTVTRIRRGAVNDEVELKLGGGERITAIITRQSVRNLGLKVGVEAVALVKASWVIVMKGGGAKLRLSARNQLTGTIVRITAGAVNGELVIELRGGNTVAAILTSESLRELGLAVGQRATALFKASSVILGAAV